MTVIVSVLIGVVGTRLPSANATGSNNLFVVAGNGGAPFPPSSSGTSSLSVGLGRPGGIGTDGNGNLFVADTQNNEVDVVVEGSASQYMINGASSPAVGNTYILAGGGVSIPSTSGLPATSVALNGPSAVTVDTSGNSLIADTADNEIDVVAESASNPGYLISGSWIRGDLYVVGGGGLGGIPTTGGVVATSATLNTPSGVGLTPSGNVIVADTSNNEIDLLEISHSTPESGRTAGEIYVVAGGGSNGAPSAVGAAATGVQLNTPSGVAVDPSGNVAISDKSHNAVDVLAEGLADPGFGIGPSWIVGDIYRIVGGGAISPTSTGVSASQAALNGPQGVNFDKVENLIFADVFHHTVDVVAYSLANPGYVLGASTSWSIGNVYVIAGPTGPSGATSAGTVANNTHFFAPIGVTNTSSGAVGIVDQGSFLLSTLSLSPPVPTTTTTSPSTTTTTLTTLAPAPVPPTDTASNTPTTTTSSSSTSSVQNTSAPQKPLITFTGGNRRVVARGFDMKVHCSRSVCRGVINITERHPVTKKGQHGSVTVIEVSVVARSGYQIAFGKVATIHVPLTSFGRRTTSSLKRSGIALVASVTVVGGTSINPHFRVLPPRPRPVHH